MPVKPRPAIERFTPKYRPLPNGCWLWTARIDSRTGDGKFFFDGHVNGAHRFAYAHFREPIPEGMHIDHLCRNRWCVNPDHLEVVTLMGNLLRGDRTHLGLRGLAMTCH